MRCRVCKSLLANRKRRRGELALCHACNQNLERAIARWVSDIDHDLEVMVAFDAYCAERELGANSFVS